jgi:carbon-monoxide dehydrogenase large subunit
MGLIGQPLKRREDWRFLTGSGNFVDDVKLPNTAWIAFVRSPHAHARILGIDTAQAQGMPGVLRVLTAADWKKAGLGELTCVHPMPFSDGRPMNEVLRPCFAAERVHHVGDVVAAVVAEDRYAALDAVDAVEVDYEMLPALTSTEHALDSGVPVLHAHFGSNMVNEVVRGNRAAADKAFAEAAHVTELAVNSNRVAGNPMEPRSYLASYERASGRNTLWATTQLPHMLRRWICKYTLFIPEHKLRVIAPDVGGGFGVKAHYSVEIATVVWAAQLLGRPVKWTCTRSELMMSDAQARDHFTRARMAFSRSGKILAMEVETLANFGAYCSNFGPSIPGNSYPQTITGLYTTPNLHLRVRGVYTNTVPIDAYRGSGRPEATLVNERLLENGAREMGIDVVEMRRRNLIPHESFPFKTPVGRTYDSGNPPLLLDRLVALADYKKLRGEQQRRRKAGELVGIGLAAFLDKSGTGNSANLASKGGLHGGYESAIVRAHSDGKVTVFVGSHSHGQGHDTAFCQVAADRLCLPLEDISLVQGDTDLVPFGNGTWGSRSLSVGGIAILKAADKVVAKAKRIAAHMLECAEADLTYAEGKFTVAGTNRDVSFAMVADNAYHGANTPKEPDFEPGLESTVFYDPSDTNDPSAMHLTLVSIDPKTWKVALEAYYTLDDAGLIVNPLIVEGQVHGGLAQGIGQAMMEKVSYDDHSGQLLSGTFMDYAMPRAVDMPPLQSDYICTPAPSNPLGVKGGSETGTIGPPAAIGNAIVDALWHLGVRHVDPPYTPHAVWAAVKGKK